MCGFSEFISVTWISHPCEASRATGHTASFYRPGISVTRSVSLPSSDCALYRSTAVSDGITQRAPSPETHSIPDESEIVLGPAPVEVVSATAARTRAPSQSSIRVAFGPEASAPPTLRPVIS